MPMGGKLAIGAIVFFALLVAVVGVVIVAGGDDDDTASSTTTTATTAPTTATTVTTTPTTDEPPTTNDDPSTTTDPDTVTLLPLPDDWELPDDTEPLETNPGNAQMRTWISELEFGESVSFLRDDLRGKGWSVETPSGVTSRPDTVFWRIERDSENFSLYVSEWFTGGTYISISASS